MHRLRSSRYLEKIESSLVWMLGSPRSGSTWLLNLIGVHPRVTMSDEPGIGYHLGLFSADVMGPHPLAFDRAPLLLPESRSQDPNYFFAKQYESSWRDPLRQLMLSRFAAQSGHAGAGRRRRSTVTLIKEPAGSQVAGFLFSVLPNAKLLFLMRDGRDTIDSILDAVEGGAWLANHFESKEQLSTMERRWLLEAQAHRWVHRTSIVGAAYEALPASQRLLVRYEDFRTDGEAAAREVFDWLGLRMDKGAVRRFLNQSSVEKMAAEKKGAGKFVRLASPRAWEQRLTTDEQALLDGIMGQSLRKYGYI